LDDGVLVVEGEWYLFDGEGLTIVYVTSFVKKKGLVLECSVKDVEVANLLFVHCM
jgi:hypothetical protein